MSTANEHFTELVTQVAALIDILLETFAADEGGTDDVGMADDADIVAQGLARYTRQVEGIGMMAESASYIALSHVCRRYQQALEQLAGCRAALTEPVRVALEEWPTLVMAYLEAPTDAEASAALVAHCKTPPGCYRCWQRTPSHCSNCWSSGLNSPQCNNHSQRCTRRRRRGRIARRRYGQGRRGSDGTPSRRLRH